MNIKGRIKKIETNNAQNFNRWLSSLSDEELQDIADQGGADISSSEWLKTLTDDELETIIYDRPGATALKERRNEYKKHNQENRSG